MLEFDNRALRSLPLDPSLENRSRQVFGACFSRVQPTKVRAPKTLAFSAEVASSLGLSEEFCQSDEFARVFSGNALLPGMDPVAACYGGHQFGNWAGQLGDGRAISLGEVRRPNGEHWELQLKGAGPTPYSRRADGRAVLRSSLREFLCSEAMHHLGIPTTRALSLVASGEDVMRDLLYDGHPRAEPGAVVCRVAPAFLRFGNFELFAFREEYGLLEQLASFAVRTYFPELGEPSKAVYVEWLREVARRTAELVSKWMAVGFVHGVMNTDNMSILGLTIDYGPYGFLDDYSPNFTPNITDASGRRYRYIAQPRVALWNLVCFANALMPLVGEAEPLEDALGVYSEVLERARAQSTAAKFGLRELREEPHNARGEVRRPDSVLCADSFELLSAVETDYTIFFRCLAEVSTLSAADALSDAERCAVIEPAFYAPREVSEEQRAQFSIWLRRYVSRVREEGVLDVERKQRMNAVNPKFVLRNYVAQLAIDRAEAGDASLVNELLGVLRTPYAEQPAHEEFAAKRPDWARNKPGCSMLSCSS